MDTELVICESALMSSTGPISTRLVVCRASVSNRVNEFTQQDGGKKRTAKRLCVTNVTGLLLRSFLVVVLNVNVSWSFTKRSVQKKV